MSDSIQGPPDTATTATLSYFPRRTRPGEAMKVLTRRVEYLNLRIHQRLSRDSTCQNGYDVAERDAVLWALDTIHHLCQKLLGPLKDALAVCDRCSVKLETRVTVNGELRVSACQSETCKYWARRRQQVCPVCIGAVPECRECYGVSRPPVEVTVL